MSLVGPLLLVLLAGAGVSGFAAMVCFLKAGVLPGNERHRRDGRSAAARLELILGLDLDEAAHRHWARAWTCTVLFLVLWASAFVMGSLVLPMLRGG
jgi:hypothetical protein